MANQLVTMQGTETKWDALRRIVRQEADESHAAVTSPQGDGGERPLIAAEEQYLALARVLRYMDALEAQERDEPEPGLTEPECFQVGEARHALVTFACTRDATSYSTERTLADHIGALLDIIGRLASQGGSNG